jgi:hypothetical protein
MIPGLLAALAVAGVLLGLRDSAGNSSNVSGPAEGVVAFPTSQARLADRVVRWSGFSQPEAVAKISAVDVLEADQAALTAEAVALQMLARDADLQLSAEQWAAMAAVTLNIQAVRQAFEASIAMASVLEPERSRIEIPAYAAAGDALREKFRAELRIHLGEAVAADVLARLGARLEGHFGGFGVSVQTLDIAGDPRRTRANLEVTRTVTYWNSVEGQDRLTTRKETYFPAQEDPAGENWEPLLSVLATRIAERAGS